MPEWYGLLLSIYSILVILFQMPTVKYKVSFSIRISFLSLLITSMILGSSSLFHLESFIGSLIWLFLLATQELFSGTIDVASNKDKSLLTKEIFVGIGGGISTLLMRSTYNPMSIGILSFIATAYCLYRCVSSLDSGSRK